jgi:hypothetical protein
LIWAFKKRVKGWKPRHKLILALVPVIIIDLALILTNGMTFTFFGLSFPLWDEYKTTLNFDGKMIFNDGNYTFIINNGVKNLLLQISLTRLPILSKILSFKSLRGLMT